MGRKEKNMNENTLERTFELKDGTAGERLVVRAKPLGGGGQGSERITSRVLLHFAESAMNCPTLSATSMEKDGFIRTSQRRTSRSIHSMDRCRSSTLKTWSI